MPSEWPNTFVSSPYASAQALLGAVLDALGDHTFANDFAMFASVGRFEGLHCGTGTLSSSEGIPRESAPKPKRSAPGDGETYVRRLWNVAPSLTPPDTASDQVRCPGKSFVRTCTSPPPNSPGRSDV